MTATRRGKLILGTSGWYYRHWNGVFYPQKMASNRYLKFYSQQFESVEVNNTFYGLPKEDTFRNWRGTTPEGFIFSIKANRSVTHDLRLAGAGEELAALLERTALLEEKLGPMLFQLPPDMPVDFALLDAFLQELPSERRYTFEFRHPSWLTPAVGDVLRAHRAALCIHDYGGWKSPRLATADFVYVRLHGPGRPYMEPYSPEALNAWAEHIRGWIETGLDVYCYFNNTNENYALENARQLGELVQE